MSTFDWIAMGFATVALGVPLVVVWTRGWARWLALAVLVDGVALAWLALTVPWTGWVLCYAWLAGFALLCWSMANIQASMAAVIALAWLAFPLWTPAGGVWLHLHPLLSLNGLTGLPPWLEQPLSYTWTRLGRDIPYDPRPGGWAFMAQIFAAFFLVVVKACWTSVSTNHRRGPSLNQ